MIPKRELRSPGLMRWDDVPPAVVDQRLSSVLLEHISARVFSGEALQLEGWVEYPGRLRARSSSWRSSATTTPS